MSFFAKKNFCNQESQESSSDSSHNEKKLSKDYPGTKQSSNCTSITQTSPKKSPNLPNTQETNTEELGQFTLYIGGLNSRCTS
jgi:TFIIF-interacting CTD phosphatase-like protein